MKKELKHNKVYMSGAMTGLPYREVWQRFCAVQRQLEAEGYDVYNPCSVQLPEGSSHGQYMRQDLPRLLGCDIIYFLNGWEKSHGCRYEMQVALATEKDIRFESFAKYNLPLQNPYVSWLAVAAKALKTTVGDLSGRRRDRYTCNRRLAVLIYLWSTAKLDFLTIGNLIHRDRTTCVQLLNNRLKFMGEVRPLVEILEQLDANPFAQVQPLPLFNNELINDKDK